ncbi:hypothetical protein HAX54_023727, partial [Datura stramonium]|nr:hypothetical protein [Datura stramonium]
VGVNNSRNEAQHMDDCHVRGTRTSARRGSIMYAMPVRQAQGQARGAQLPRAWAGATWHMSTALV